MDAIHSVLETTNVMLHTLKQTRVEKKHSQMIEKIVNLIAEREKAIEKLDGPYNKEEIEKGKEIIQLNRILLEEMMLFLEEIKMGMQGLHLQKTQNYAYLQPHARIQLTDGMYLDCKL